VSRSCLALMRHINKQGGAQELVALTGRGTRESKIGFKRKFYSCRTLDKHTDLRLEGRSKHRSKKKKKKKKKKSINLFSSRRPLLDFWVLGVSVLGFIGLTRCHTRGNYRDFFLSKRAHTRARTRTRTQLATLGQLTTSGASSGQGRAERGVICVFSSVRLHLTPKKRLRKHLETD
jgi:hypothetical protein